ncbi:RnfABCDGE type electron transport complex subunit B [Synergistaceae bacterium OttesenSCG-928-D05]|nr:RnfABCDGE type electron transport complex subunit B [Synergistaceae bacterium OttesenSCG-928-D05]
MTGMIYPAIIMGGLGLIFGALLAYASKAFYVEVDPRQIQVRTVLPGANCGGCGYAGCDGYAEAVVAGEAPITSCAAGGSVLVERLSEILGVEASGDEPKVAFLKCQGSPEKTVKDSVYYGFADCRQAAVVPGKGPNACRFGCLGLGTCARVCVFGAMSIRDGLAVVDIEKCVGCGTCVAQCPREVLSLVPRKTKVQVACSSPLRGPDVKKACSVGCIGCTMCVRSCPVQAIEMKGALAEIHVEKCINCGVCVSKCPTKCIIDRRSKWEREQAEKTLCEINAEKEAAAQKETETKPAE